VTTAAPSLLAGRILGRAASARLSVEGREYLNFFGSGYLALTDVPDIRAAVKKALDSGVPFSQHVPAVLGGIDPLFAAAEKACAAACHRESSVYLPSGYLVGAVGLAAAAGSFDVLLIDAAAHYNLRDAAKVQGVPILEYAHCDVQSLREILVQHIRPGQRPLLLTDGVFATTGHLAPLAEYVGELLPYGGRLFVDESHAFGVVGAHGRGAAEECNVEEHCSEGSTLSKALCAQGAFVTCTSSQAQRLRSVPPLRGACAGSPLSAVATAAALDYVAAHPEFRIQLRALAEYFRSRVREIGLSVPESPAPIVSFSFGTRAAMVAVQQRLFERGIYVYHSTYLGAGPEGMIRCAVFRDHSRSDIDTLVGALSELI
jgi:7-keto-8-aminopelargonate synthetase-like enzyme